MQRGRAKGSHWLTFKKIGLAFTERLGLKATRFATNVTAYLQLFFSTGHRMPTLARFQITCFCLATFCFQGMSVLAEVTTSLSDQGESTPQIPAERLLPSDPAAIIAYVGQSPILMGDLSSKVDAQLNAAIARMGTNIPEAELDQARARLTRGMLQQTIQTKMMREAFLLDQVGTQSAEKREEADARLTMRARQMFFETEVPELQKQYKVESLSDLDDALREKGSSLSARQRDFMDAMLGHLYISSKVEREPNVTVSEINEHYLQHSEDYQRPTRARWEQLSVRFDQFPDRESAHAAIWEMGREAYFGGSMQAVAREKSQEPFAKSGGVHNWTTKGALASDAIDQQVFSIPLNAMSEIIEDQEGFHIIRVLDRQEAGVVPLSEVQDTIRSTIREKKISDSQSTVLDEMQGMVPVWSLFPEDTPGALPLPESIARGFSQQVNRR